MNTPPKVKATVKLALKPIEYTFEIEDKNTNDLFQKINETLEHTGLETSDFERSFECTITNADGTTINHILSFPQAKNRKV